MAMKASASALEVYRELAALMGELGIEEEDLDDLVYADEVPETATVT